MLLGLYRWLFATAARPERTDEAPGATLAGVEGVWTSTPRYPALQAYVG